MVHLKHLDLVKVAFRRLKIPQSAIDRKIIEGDCDRAANDVICQRCGLKYIDHPTVEGMDFLIVTCEWRVYKM